MEKDFKSWEIDLLNRNTAKIQEIATKFANAKAILEKKPSIKDEKVDFTIWLNRSEQRREYNKSIKSEKNESPFIFGVVGCFKNDRPIVTTKMLQKYYFNKILNNNGELILPKRKEESLELISSGDAKYEYDEILEKVLEIPLKNTSCECEEYPELLEKEYGKYHVIVRCRIKKWNKEGLSSFLDLWKKSIKRNAKLPFILLLEFKTDNETELKEVFSSETENNSMVLLPTLTKVTDDDITEFYDTEIGESQCYKDKFICDEESLCTKDAPLFYSEAVAKLRLK